MKATSKDLRFHSREIIETARRGEEVLITFRGQPYVKIVPLDSEMAKEKAPQNKLFGMWKDREDIKDVQSYVRALRKGRFS